MEASNINAMRDALNEIRSRLSYLYGHIVHAVETIEAAKAEAIGGTE